MQSRNVREGRYAGKALGYHYRYKDYCDMLPDAFIATGCLLRTIPRKAKIPRRFRKTLQE